MPRRGYTLFELVLVMTLIVVAASLTFPLAEALLTPNRIGAAGDTIRAQWAEMRGRAMSEGRAYRFLVINNTGKFRIEPEDDDDAPGWVFEDDLPETVVFVKDESVLIGATGPPAPGSEYELVAVYLPDGTTRENVLLSYGVPGIRPMTLRIRALTGAVTLFDPAAGGTGGTP